MIDLISDELAQALEDLHELAEEFPASYSPERVAINCIIERVANARHMVNEGSSNAGQ